MEIKVKNLKHYEFGDKLPNGAVVLKSIEDHVLAVKPNMEFVTWFLFDDIHTADGHYFIDFKSALDDFLRRIH